MAMKIGKLLLVAAFLTACGSGKKADEQAFMESLGFSQI